MGENKEQKSQINPVLDGIDWSISHFAGAKARNAVFEGKTLEELSTYSEKDLAIWIKGAMERLDALVDRGTRIGLMEYCGGMCADVHRRDIQEAKERRMKYRNLDEFLEAEHFAREGDIVYQSYNPRASGVRCFCLGKNLPAEDKMSPTYCQCSKGFVKQWWKEILGRPVRVELVHSAISGAQDCKFAIYLNEKVPEYPFKCKVCGTCFKTSKELKEHIAFS